MKANKQSGFVLMMTLILSGVVTIMLGGVYGYVRYVTHSAASYENGTKCRLAAQSILEKYKTLLHKNFRETYRSNSYKNLSELVNSSMPNFLRENFNGNFARIISCDIIDRNTSLTFGKNPYIIVKIKASASSNIGDANVSKAGRLVEKTVEEVVKIEIKRSTMDYALFVNGQASVGSTAPILQKLFEINGDCHANGDFEILFAKGRVTYADGVKRSQASATVNGNISAAKMSDDVIGRIHTTDFGNKVIDVTADTIQADTWDSYQKKKAQGTDTSRPTNPTSNMQNAANWEHGYSGQNTITPHSSAVEMPYIDNLDVYKTVAQNAGSTLEYKDIITGEVKTINAVHDYSAVGPSGSENGADRGTLLLVGTDDDPIVINGPVVIPKDVVIRGVVQGQGSIYSGRNISIIGDIKYKNPPSWKSNDTTPEQTAVNNASKDMLALCARGNIVIGKPEKKETMPFTGDNFYEVFFSDHGNRTVDQGSYYTLGFGLSNYKLYGGESPFAYRDPDGTYFDGDYLAHDGYKRVVEVKDEHGRISYRDTDARYCDPLVSEEIIKKYATYEISHIDATMYSNNCTMMTGRGWDVWNQRLPVEINGAVITRNMLFPTFSGALKLNWDIRLGSRSVDAAKMANSPMNTSLPFAPTRPTTLTWRELASN